MIENSNTTFADKVSSLCLQKYAKLPKKGKPQKGKEWTLLAGIIIVTDRGSHSFVLALPLN